MLAKFKAVQKKNDINQDAVVLKHESLKVYDFWHPSIGVCTAVYQLYSNILLHS